jgi:bifunctional DNase/RNase
VETQAILIGLENIKTERPLTHDLFLDLINRCGNKFIRVEICDLKDDVFYARLVIASADGMTFSLDARPSDALALAVRSDCSIFVASPVMEESGVPADIIIDDIQETVASGIYHMNKCPSFSDPGKDPAAFSVKPREKSESFGEELEEALAEENYERAAQIRDILWGLDKKENRPRLT